MEHSALLACLPAAALLIRPDGAVRSANDHALRLFRASGDAIGSLSDLLPAEADPLALVATAAGAARPVRVHARRFDHVPFTAELEVADAAGGGFLCLVRELRDAALLEESQRYLDAAFERAPIGMALFNTNGEYVRVNPALCALLGRSADDLIGRRDQELTHPDDRRSDVDAAWRVLGGELDSWQTEKRFIAADGSTVWAIASLSFLRDGAGRPLAWLGQFQDITEQKLQTERFEHLAGHDSLTGVANRRRLIAELERRIAHAGRHEERGAVLVLDLDGFKQINDAGGHAVGDRILVDVAAALQARMRATDLLGRLGGDEFTAVLPHVGEDGARIIARDLLDAVSGASPELTASCGIALYGPDRAGDPFTLLAAADQAMYAAKSRGRNCALVATD
jgi:diguanylate cyclase (GGDEF)-like protein/PAS domain S-box-containing protein